MCFLFCICFCFISLHSKSQIIVDSSHIGNETKVLETFPDSIFTFNTRNPIPKRAGLYSACVPGLGQIYNKQYWKTGLIFAGSAVVTGFIISNYRQYTKYNKAYIGMIDNNPNTPDTFEDYTVDDVNLIRKGYRQYLEYSVLAATAGYMLNILDAFIAAHLKSFDMSKDISFQTRPMFNREKQIGLCLALTIK
ncbi:MAG: hypothetical protein IPI46_08440 [Bacteroidetes bacterium]|nr:hypothetical protein [Bacteroidota bacterium]